MSLRLSLPRSLRLLAATTPSAQMAGYLMVRTLHRPASMSLVVWLARQRRPRGSPGVPDADSHAMPAPQEEAAAKTPQDHERHWPDRADYPRRRLAGAGALTFRAVEPIGDAYSIETLVKSNRSI